MTVIDRANDIDVDVTLKDVDVTANDVEIPTFRPTIADPRTLTS
jgi:hypothetical protein